MICGKCDNNHKQTQYLNHQKGEGILMTIKENLKKILIEELNLEDLTPEEIEDDAPLFGEGLGLDSLDAVELVVLLEKHFGVVVKNLDEGREAFQSVNTLVALIEERLNQCV
jgi:acyl carrier protein